MPHFTGGGVLNTQSLPFLQNPYRPRIWRSRLSESMVISRHFSPPSVKVFCGVSLLVNAVLGAFHSTVVPSGVVSSVFIVNAQKTLNSPSLSRDTGASLMKLSLTAQ